MCFTIQVLTTAWEVALQKVVMGDWFVPPDVDNAVTVKSNMPAVLMYGSYLGFLLMSVFDKGVTGARCVS